MDEISAVIFREFISMTLEHKQAPLEKRARFPLLAQIYEKIALDLRALIFMSAQAPIEQRSLGLPRFFLLAVIV